MAGVMVISAVVAAVPTSALKTTFAVLVAYITKVMKKNNEKREDEKMMGRVVKK